jgi:hypothetical protein
MQVRKPTTRLTDIGRLDATLRLPTAGRIQKGMKTTCARCGKAITDPTFIAGFKAGHHNLMLHEACMPADEPQPPEWP